MKRNILKNIGIFTITPAIATSAIIPITSCSKTDKYIDFPVDKFYITTQDFKLGFASTITKKTNVIVEIATKSINSLTLKTNKITISNHYGEVMFHIDEFKETVFDFSLYFIFPSTNETIRSKTISCAFLPAPERNEIKFVKEVIENTNNFSFKYTCQFRHQPFYDQKTDKVTVYLSNEIPTQNYVSLDKWNNDYTNQKFEIQVKPERRDDIWCVDIPIYARPKTIKGTNVGFRLSFQFTNRFGQTELITSNNLSANVKITAASPIPTEYLNIDYNGVLNGFKLGVQQSWVNMFKELRVPSNVSSISSLNLFQTEEQDTTINLDRITFEKRTSPCDISSGALKNVKGLNFINVSDCGDNVFKNVSSNPFTDATSVELNNLPGVIIASDSQIAAWKDDKDIITEIFKLGNWEKISIKNTLIGLDKYITTEQKSETGEIIGYELNGIKNSSRAEYIQTIKAVVIPDEITTINSNAFDALKTNPFTKTVGSTTTTEGRYLFTSYQLRSIEEGTFENFGLCGGIISFSQFITSIPDNAFKNATSYSASVYANGNEITNQKKLIINFNTNPQNPIGNIGNNAFSGLKEVHEIDLSPLSNNVKFGESIFANTNYIKKYDGTDFKTLDLIKFPNCESIGNLMFNNIQMIEAIDFTAYNEIPSWQNQKDEQGNEAVWNRIFGNGLASDPFLENNLTDGFSGQLLVKNGLRIEWMKLVDNKQYSVLQQFLFVMSKPAPEKDHWFSDQLFENHFGAWAVIEKN